MDRDVDREKIFQRERKQQLKDDSESTAERRPDEAHDRRLRDVDRQYLPARRAETAQHSHGVDLSHDERVYAARDADPPEQERDKTDHAEKVAQLIDRLREIDFGVLHGTHPRSFAGDGTAQ